MSILKLVVIQKVIFLILTLVVLATGRVYKFLILLESEYGDFLHEDKRRFIM